METFPHPAAVPQPVPQLVHIAKLVVQQKLVVQHHQLKLHTEPANPILILTDPPVMVGAVEKELVTAGITVTHSMVN